MRPTRAYGRVDRRGDIGSTLDDVEVASEASRALGWTAEADDGRFSDGIAERSNGWTLRLGRDDLTLRLFFYSDNGSVLIEVSGPCVELPDDESIVDAFEGFAPIEFDAEIGVTTTTPESAPIETVAVGARRSPPST